ncbi:hypothetical protein [Pseudomonas benzenivorans]|uniref:Uncharacterized protein n=1 Tax=Pseudomonas benzenivorans TaxID=556533 RepID=A0ABY5H7I7_9PSED|nr:hypothetical protein [Pseudomonas benzenivorans]UTW08293.1 hypothetical protein KDW96_02900 [Pseudomonas benzenivorans]
MATSKISRALVGVAAAVYGLLYLYAVGDLDLGPAGWGWSSLPWDWQRLIAQRGPWHFEAIAMLELGHGLVLLSPLNLLLAALLGLLLGANLHGALALRRRPSCSSGARAAWSIGLWPALLAGGACCAPSLLLLVGIPGLGAFVGLFSWLLPLSLTLLIGSRLWQRRRGAPRLLGLL